MPKHSPAAKILNKIDYSQAALFVKLKKYLIARDAKNTNRSVSTNTYLPFNNTAGICSGIGALWAYMVRVDEEGKFIDLIHHAATWDSKKYAKLPVNRPSDLNDQKLDRLMSQAFFLHHHAHTIDPEIQKHDLYKSFALLLGEQMEQVAAPEFSISFVFDIPELAELFQQTIFDRKMLRFENGLHAVYAILKDGVYYFYDPAQKQGLQTTTDVKELATMVFKSLSAHCHSKKHIALNMLAFDLKGAAPQIYPERMEYYTKKLQDPKYKKAVLEHHNILRVGLRHDLDMLDLLFKHRYTPSSLRYENSELVESILENDLAKVNYLLDHNVDSDFKPYGKESAIGAAIRTNALNSLYLLLIKNANPNVKAFHNLSALEYALYHRNIGAMVLLLAYNGTENKAFTQGLIKKFGEPKAKLIRTQANELRRRLDNDANIAPIAKPSTHQLLAPKKEMLFSASATSTGTSSEDTARTYERLVLPLLKVR